MAVHRFLSKHLRVRVFINFLVVKKIVGWYISLYRIQSAKESLKYMKKVRFFGSYVALVTPFFENMSVDFEAFKKLVKLHIDAKTDGIVICGTTGEAATLTLDEKKELMRLTCELTQGSCKIIFGSGSNDTAAAVKLTEMAQDLGADGVLVVTPYYNKPPQQGLVAHYKAVAGSTSLPVILYNVPGRTGCNMLPETVLTLAETPNIVAVKEASGILEQTMAVVKGAPEGFGVFSGDDALNFPIMACGGIGTISVTANVAPKMMKAFNDAALKEDFALARKIHYQLLDLHKNLFVETNPLPAKAALAQRGLMQDHSRLPLCRPTENTHKIIEKTIMGLE
jgi:4-hydroxy-tetrahydrodipicolinate synthase